MLARLGLRWAATDEGILARSVDHWRRDDHLYRAYRVPGDGGDVAFLFRDRDLSDAIGFIYSQNTAESSVEDFCGRLRAVAQRSPESRPLVSVILDGENPWEHYPDGGEGFLRGLYAALTRKGADGVRFQMVTPGRELDEHPPLARVERLYTGSWINADFKIWLGHAEDNDAWDRVGKTRRFLARREQEGGVASDRVQAAWDELYAAEGSDWFWWYGDEFETDHKPLFDHVFRLHLANVYRLLQAEVPEFLKIPVMRLVAKTAVREPTVLITPSLDGVVTDFYEWQGAGSVDCRPPLSSMHKGPVLFNRIYFGFSLEQFYMRLDPVPPEEEGPPLEESAAQELNESPEVHIHFVEPRPVKLVFRLDLPDPPQFTLWASSDGSAFSFVQTYDSIRRKKIIELAVPFKDLGVHPQARVHLVIKVMRGGLELERFPRDRPLAFTVPDHTFEGSMWKV
jgi:hypothetical protein